jgi:hypothetical protein
VEFVFLYENGWLHILDKYFEVVERELPAGVDYKIGQIKEKLGTLRIYDNSYDSTAGAVNAIADAHALAEAHSLHTCEYCGRRGRFGSAEQLT